LLTRGKKETRRRRRITLKREGSLKKKKRALNFAKKGGDLTSGEHTMRRKGRPKRGKGWGGGDFICTLRRERKKKDRDDALQLS